MEGFGFQNFDESFESSSPPTYTSDPYGFESTGNRPKKTSKGNKDMYDFDVSNDEEDTPKKAVRTRVVRRMSTDDRMNEILEKSKRSKPAVVSHNVDSKDTEDDTYNSWKNSWNQLMEGVGGDSPKPTALEDSVDSPSLVVAKNRQGNDRVLNTSDSLDISDADFEVGVHAARRSIEKASERRRRSAMESLPSKHAESPDLAAAKYRRSTLAGGGSILSSALSSIAAASQDGSATHGDGASRKDGGLLRYGSVGGRSDGDLLKILAEARPQFRSPVQSLSLDHDLDDDDSLTPTNSKRRQQQLSRSSLSPHVTSGVNTMGGLGKEKDRSGGSVSGTDNDSEAPEYSLDDFDPDSPVKKMQPTLSQQSAAPTSTSVPSVTVASNPVSDIMARWLNPNPTSLVASKLFGVVEEDGDDNVSTSPSPPPPAHDRSDKVMASPQLLTEQDKSSSTRSNDSDHGQLDNSPLAVETTAGPSVDDYEDDGDGLYDTQQREERWEDEEDGYEATIKSTVSTAQHPPPFSSQSSLSQPPPRPPSDGHTSLSINSPVSQIPAPPPDDVGDAWERAEGQSSHGQQVGVGVGNSFEERGVRYSMDSLQHLQPHYGYYSGEDACGDYNVHEAVRSSSTAHAMENPPDPMRSLKHGESISSSRQKSVPRRPTSSEISPRAVLLSRSSQVLHYAPTDRLSDLTRGVSWSGGGGSLPVVPPSALELHAHIAASSVAAAAVDKSHVSSTVKLLKSKGKVPKGVGRSSPASVGRQKRASTNTEGAAEISSIRRIEIGNSKLLRQFEELDKEIRQMKAARLAGQNSHTVPASSTRKVERQGAPDRRQAKTLVEGRVSIEVPPPPPPVPEDSVGDQEALRAIKMIFHESVDKEAQLREREQALNIRESMLEKTQRRLFVGEQGHKLASAGGGSSSNLESSRVAQMQAEIETLKAELYRAKEAEQALLQDRAAKEQRTRASEQVSPGREERKTELAVGETLDEALAREVGELERVVRMYEKENARLADALSQKEKELKAARADFFDKQEALVKQVNRLQNQCHGATGIIDTALTVSTSTRNFEDELERDALYRNMTEQISLLDKSCRKKDEKIADLTEALNASEREKIVLERALAVATGGKRTENGASLASRRGLFDDEEKGDRLRGSHGWAGAEDDREGTVDSLREVLLQERAAHKVEVDGLQKRLHWYTETQELVDAVKAERDEYKRVVDQLVRSQKQGELDTSIATATPSATAAGIAKRNPSDVRRIRELDNALSAARDSIQKRFPDSVANLLYANIAAMAGTGGAGELNSDLHALIKERDDLRKELESCQTEATTVITTLRQEHERMKLAFERQREQDRAKFSARAVAVPEGQGSEGIDSLSGQTVVKTFSQAKDRIRLLEVENSRLRTFYSRKVESLQNKYLAQVNAIRRGTDVGEESAVSVALADGFDKERAALQSRIELMENELLLTAEQLGKAKAQAAEAEAQLIRISSKKVDEVSGEISRPQAFPTMSSVEPPIISIEDWRQVTNEVTVLRSQVTDMSRQLEVAQRELEMSRGGQVPISSAVRENGDNQRVVVAAEDESATFLRQQLHELKEDKARLAALAKEIQWRHESELAKKDQELQAALAEIRLQAEIARKPHTPQMQSFMLIESRVAELEQRLRRREHEMQTALEDCRASESIERMRLQAIHEQELREKDEMILQFQVELENLVISLHKYEEYG